MEEAILHGQQNKVAMRMQFSAANHNETRTLYILLTFSFNTSLQHCTPSNILLNTITLVIYESTMWMQSKYYISLKPLVQVTDQYCSFQLQQVMQQFLLWSIWKFLEIFLQWNMPQGNKSHTLTSGNKQFVCLRLLQWKYFYINHSQKKLSFLFYLWSNSYP